MFLTFLPPILASAVTDLYGIIPSSHYLDAAHGVYVERTGSVSGLTPANIGGPVGTWVSRDGAQIFRAPSDGARPTLRKTGNTFHLEFAASQYMVSDSAASTWKFMHDGTTWQCGIGYRIANATPNKTRPLISTHIASQTQVGTSIWYDDLSAGDNHNGLHCLISRGGSPNVVNGVSQSGQLGGDWDYYIGWHDPDQATTTNRVKRQWRNMESWMNVLSNNTGVVSSSNPQHTLHIGAFGGASGVSTHEQCDISSIILYQGTWSANDISSLQDFYDLANYGNYTEDAPFRNISDQYAAYEAFGTLHRAPNGDLIAFWRSATTHAFSKGTITRAVSTDNGTTWTFDRDVVSHSTYDCKDFCGVFLDNGDFLGGCNLDDQGGSGNNTGLGMYVVRSSDNGQTFTEVTTLAPTVTELSWAPYSRWHKLSDGTIIVSCFCRTSNSPTTFKAVVIETEDEGETWAIRSTIQADANETCIYNITGTTWLAVIRTQVDGPIATKVSTDDCLTWSTVAATFESTSFKGASPHIFQVNGETWVAICDRVGKLGLRFARWIDNRLHGVDSENMTYVTGTTGSDQGYPFTVVDDDGWINMLYFDEGIADPGILFRRCKMPNL